MDKRKNSRKLFLLSVAAIILCFLIVSCVFGIRISRDTEVKLMYSYGPVSISDNLTQEEVETLRSILHGKFPMRTTTFGMPACGFDEEISFEISGVRYMVACDTCGTLMTSDGGIIHLRDDQIAAIHEIFEKRGGKFPCV